MPRARPPDALVAIHRLGPRTAPPERVRCGLKRRARGGATQRRELRNHGTSLSCAGLTKAAVEARGRSRQGFRVDPPSGPAKLDLMPLFWIDAGALSEQAALRLATLGIASSLPAMENTMALDGPPAPFLKSPWKD